MNYQFYSPTKIFFGLGSSEFLSEVAKKYSQIFVLSTKSLSTENHEKIKQLLGSSAESFNFYDRGSEPTIEGIYKLSKRKTDRTNCILGIGGGSVLDSSKVLAIQEQDIDQFNETYSQVLPIVTMPTTAGTGGELTKSAIVKQGDIKRGIRSEKLFPELAIVDPSFCDTLPLHDTKYTSFDALTHSIETHHSRKSNLLTRTFSEQSMATIFSYLPKALQEFEESGKPSLKTREALSHAAMLQGINLSNSSTCLPHRIQYAISTVSDASHAIGIASVYGAWLRRAKPKIGTLDYKAIIDFMDRVNINTTLSDIGVGKENIEGIVQRVKGALENDPFFSDLNQVREILEESL